MKSTQSLISVILPVYNAESYLEKSIESILNQSHSNFELLICDDASSDRSLEVIQKFIDPRIKVLIHKNNKGLVATLNELLKASKGDYIARMDNDDISHPDRLRKQLAFLVAHPKTAVVGCLYARIDTKGNIIKIDPVVLSSADIRVALGVKNCFCHGSVMLNKQAIPTPLLKYSEQYKHAEDYYFWSKLSKNGLELANMPDVLYYWRSHIESISKIAHTQQSDNVSNLINDNLHLRTRILARELWDFAMSGFFVRSSTVVINDTQFSTNMTLHHQYVLYRWGVLMWKHTPTLAFMSLLLSFCISPISILKVALKIN